MEVDVDIEDDLLEKAMLFVAQSTSLDQLIEMALATFIESRSTRQMTAAESAAKRDE
ncbi:hypothetical protein [Aquabacterium sp.]|uniref:hypothetical protein n=1 Tax=Aquabacterium sp. TaxID=1872578 RepID=UPI002E323CD2|nr:hypothetical protein [Aquabacterium sp.]HEX5312671.1 hypothetical protein [Aquabacterium sp.]